MLHQEKSQKGKVPQQQQCCCCSRCCDSTHEAVAHHKKEEALNARRQTQKVSPSKKLYTFSWCYCPTEYILIWPRMFSITGNVEEKIVSQQLNPLSKFSSFLHSFVSFHFMFFCTFFPRDFATFRYFKQERNVWACSPFFKIFLRARQRTRYWLTQNTLYKLTAPLFAILS